MFKHRRLQYPIGQGYFHSASLEINDSRIEYCYDCGSENSEPLHAEVKRYAEEHDAIDVLFLSHLDSDHVSGLDELLLLCSVDTVVLPYLSKYERLYVLSDTIANGPLSLEHVRLLGHPARWFASRGVKHVIFIFGEYDEGPPSDVPNDGPPPSIGKRRDTSPTISEDDKLSINFAELDEFGYRIEQIRECAIYRVPHNHILRLSDSSGQLINWSFTTFVHPENAREAEFRAAVEAAFLIPEGGADGNVSSLFYNILKDKELRNRLAECYLTIRSDRNLTSMSLYSGPLFPLSLDRFVYTMKSSGRTGTQNKRYGNCGWLGTGDANLKGPRRRSRFLKHFDAILPEVLTLSIPHHGSKNNFNREIVPINCQYCIVSARDKNPHHPDPDVVVALQRMNRNLAQTNENANTIIIEEIQLESEYQH